MMEERLLLKKDVEARVGLCGRQIDKLAKTGRFPVPIHLGRSVRWRAADLDAFIAAGCNMDHYLEARHGRPNPR